MIQRKTQGLAFSNGQNLHILLYVINTAPSMTMVDSNHEIKPNGNDLVMLCSFPQFCRGTCERGRSFINTEGIVCFSQVTLTIAIPHYYEGDKPNFPMNDLGLFILTNHQGKRHLFKKRPEKIHCFAYGALQLFTITRHWYLTKAAFSFWVKAYHIPNL